MAARQAYSGSDSGERSELLQGVVEEPTDSFEVIVQLLTGWASCAIMVW
jgi:hypothetical protein